MNEAQQYSRRTMAPPALLPGTASKPSLVYQKSANNAGQSKYAGLGSLNTAAFSARHATLPCCVEQNLTRTGPGPATPRHQLCCCRIGQHSETKQNKTKIQIHRLVVANLVKSFSVALNKATFT